MDVARGGRHAIEVVQADGRGAAEAVVGAENYLPELYRAQAEGETPPEGLVLFVIMSY